VGTTVVLAITSTGFSLDGPYQVLWSKSPISDEGNYTLVATGEVPKGSMQATAIFTVPEAIYGTNYVQFRRGWRPTDNPYNFTFNILPDIKVTSTSAFVGSEVTIRGTGFPANKNDINLVFDDKDTKLSISTNDRGSFTAQFTIPDTMAGNHQFKAYNENLAIGEVTANLQVGPTISLEPEHPEIGTEVTLSGWGFAARSTVSVKYDDAAVSNSPTTNDTGNFTEKFKVPESSTVNHVITATDKAGNVATFGLPLEGTPPSVPTPVSPSQQRFGWFGSQTVIFTWTPVSDPSGITYVLEVDKSLRFFPLEPGMRRTGLTQPNCIMTLEPGTYYWHVKSIDGAGNESDWSLSPYPFQVAFFSGIYLAAGAFVFIIVFIFIVRAFFRRLKEFF
jgi:hypothetical protein